MQIISNVALISINETFLVQLVSFLIFLFIFNRIMIRPLRDVMQQRRDKVSDTQQEMTEAQKELEVSVEQMRQKEAAVLKSAHELRARLEEDGSRQAQEILLAARDEVEKMRRNAEVEVSTLIAEVRKGLQAESETLATSIIDKILDRRPVS